MNNQQLFKLYKTLDESLDMVRKEIKTRKIDWRILADNSLKIEAIMAYSKKHNSSVSDAKAAVELFLSN